MNRNNLKLFNRFLIDENLNVEKYLETFIFQWLKNYSAKNLKMCGFNKIEFLLISSSFVYEYIYFKSLYQKDELVKEYYIEM